MRWEDLSYLPKAVPENTATRFDNSWHHTKIHITYRHIMHFLNNGQKKTLLSEFSKVLEPYTVEELGN